MVGDTQPGDGTTEEHAALAAFFAQSHTAMALLGLDGAIDRTNAAWTALLGPHDAAATLGARTHEGDRLVLTQVLRELRLHGGTRTLELRFARPDGGVVWLECEFVAEPSASRCFCAARDVTARRQREDALGVQSALIERLRRSEAQYRDLIERLPDGVVVVRDEKFFFANAAAARILGYDSPSQLVGLHFSAIVRPEEVSTSADRIRRMSRPGELEPPPSERPMVRRDGSVVYAETVGFTIEFDGAPAVLVIAHDVTAQKQIQARIVQAERLASVGTLAAGVAHEINNPLAYVLLNLEQIARRLGQLATTTAPPGLRECLALVAQSREGAERVRDIVRDLKTFSRSDDARSVAVDVRAVLDSTIHMATNEIRHRARLVREYAEVPTVFANESRLAQVFLNLLLNAAQSIPEGDAAGNEIRVVVRAEGDEHVVVEVRDTGAGIGPEARAHIFEPFFTTKPVGVGTGLGLSVCLGIVEALGGAIAVDSAPGGGSTFRVTLPTHRADAVAAVVEPAPTAVPRARVLVIDDEPSIARAFAAALTGHETVVATSGREALARLHDGHYDAVFCDVMMPDVSGIEVYEQTRREAPALARRFVFMTGGAFVPRAAEFLASVPNVCIDKPFDWAQVQRLIARLVRART